LSTLLIRPAETADAAAICEIYNHYIEHTVVTFEEVLLTAGDIDKRLQDINAIGLPWLVAEVQGVVIGYAYAGKFRDRSAYRYTAEVTVYLAPAGTGQGAGTRLYNALFEALRERSIHIVIGGITLPNVASVALHEKMGMEKVAHLEEVGCKFGKWLDVGYWQATL
jgi:phosphinothricin acetyltransferase